MSLDGLCLGSIAKHKQETYCWRGIEGNLVLSESKGEEAQKVAIDTGFTCQDA